MKRCFKCKANKQAKNFYKDKDRSDGLYTYCKFCVTIIQQNDYRTHRQKRLEYRRKYRKIRREEIKAGRKIYKANHKEQEKEYQRKYYLRVTRIKRTLKRQKQNGTLKTQEPKGFENMAVVG